MRIRIRRNLIPLLEAKLKLKLLIVLKGNMFWRNYLATPELSLLTAVHVIRERLGIPPPSIEEVESDQELIRHISKVWLFCNRMSFA